MLQDLKGTWEDIIWRHLPNSSNSLLVFPLSGSWIPGTQSLSYKALIQHHPRLQPSGVKSVPGQGSLPPLKRSPALSLSNKDFLHNLDKWGGDRFVLCYKESSSHRQGSQSSPGVMELTVKTLSMTSGNWRTIVSGSQSHCCHTAPGSAGDCSWSWLLRTTIWPQEKFPGQV